MFAEGDDGGGVAGDFFGGGGDGAEEGGVAFRAEGLDCFCGEGGAGGLETVVAGGEGGEGEGEGKCVGEGFEDAAACLGRSVCAFRGGGRGLTGMTSRPMPSPGRRPMRRERVAIEASWVLAIEVSKEIRS